MPTINNCKHIDTGLLKKKTSEFKSFDSVDYSLRYRVASVSYHESGIQVSNSTNFKFQSFKIFSPKWLNLFANVTCKD